MSFRLLSDFVRDALEVLPRMPGVAPEGIREASALLAMQTWGPRLVAEQPLLTNMAALALHMSARLEVADMRPGAAHLVHATDLHSLPAEPPRLLRAPAVLLEVRHPDRERLLDPLVSVGAYPHEGGYYVVGIDWPDGAWGGMWRPTWGDGDLASGIRLETHPMIEAQPGEHHDRIAAAARMLVVLGLLLDAEGAPLRQERETVARPAHSAASRAGVPERTTRHLYLDNRRGTSSSSSSSSGGHADLSDREQGEVPVRGHLKRQPHGPGGSLRKWVWIEGYEARRWVGSRPRTTVVH